MIFQFTAQGIIPWRDHRRLLWLGFSLILFPLLFPIVCSASQVRLSWDPSISPVDGYRIFMREERNTYDYDRPEWEGTDTTCTIYGLDEGIVYCFVVRAYNEYGESDDSNEARTSSINSWVRINGTITYRGSPLCATVLANGQYTFTCGDNLGLWSLDVPLDEYGEITLYGFCSGFSPFKAVLTPLEAEDFDINLTRADAGSREIETTVQTEPGTTNLNRVRISGTVTYDGKDLCGMVLVNGESMFSCGADLGTFDLEVPLDANGEITLYVFCSGMSPYKQVFTP
jgi:hypothetical protein